jgi:hypothetical protein
VRFLELVLKYLRQENVLVEKGAGHRFRINSENHPRRNVLWSYIAVGSIVKDRDNKGG